MAIKKYTAGQFMVENVAIGGLKEMTLTINVETGDTSTIGTAWAKAVELGKNWSVAITCDYNPDDTVQAALITAYTSGNAVLSHIGVYEDASTSHYGSALLTSAVVTKSVGSADKFNATFVGDGALVHA